jgi:hypothetical protein
LKAFELHFDTTVPEKAPLLCNEEGQVDVYGQVTNANDIISGFMPGPIPGQRNSNNDYRQNGTHGSY